MRDRTTSGSRRMGEWAWLVIAILLLALTALVIGAIIEWVRFRTAQLPAFSATGDLGPWRLFLTG